MIFGGYIEFFLWFSEEIEFFKIFKSKGALGAFYGYKVESKKLLRVSGWKYTHYGYHWKALKIWSILFFELWKSVQRIKSQQKLVIFRNVQIFDQLTK